MSNVKPINNRNSLLAFASITVLIEILGYLLKFLSPYFLLHFWFVMLVGITPFLMKVIWLVLIGRKTAFFKSFNAYLFLCGLTIYALGLLAKVEHWAWANWALIIGAASALLAYSLRFFAKKNRLFLDHLKYALVASYFIINVLVHEHLVSALFSLVHTALFYAVIFLFASNQEEIDCELPAEEFSFEKEAT